MRRQIGWLNLDQIRLHVLDNSLTNFLRQEFDDGRMNRRRRGEGPTFLAFALDGFSDVIGQLAENPAIVFALDSLTLGGSALTPAAGITNRKTPRLVGQFILIAAVRVGGIKRLHQPQTRAALVGLLHFVSFQAAAVGDDDE